MDTSFHVLAVPPTGDRQIQATTGNQKNADIRTLNPYNGIALHADDMSRYWETTPWSQENAVSLVSNLCQQKEPRECLAQDNTRDHQDDQIDKHKMQSHRLCHQGRTQDQQVIRRLLR